MARHAARALGMAMGGGLDVAHIILPILGDEGVGRTFCFFSLRFACYITAS